MNPGLSSRTKKIVDELDPTPLTLAPQQTQRPSTIDLSNAQNEVVRRELLDVFKHVDDGELLIAKQIFALPTVPGGDPRLRRNLAEFFNTYSNPLQPVQREHIVLTAGASDAIEHVIYAVCDDGDSILVPGPFWPGIEYLASSWANVNIIVAEPPTYTNYASYLVPSLQAAYDFSPVKGRIKAVLLTNSSNPLGRCYPRDVLIECLEFCQERELHLISDELYALTELGHIKKGEEFVSVLSLTDPFLPEGAIKVDPNRVHIVWSASKLFGVSGLRIGCLVSQHNRELIRAMALLTTAHANTISTLYFSSLLSSSYLPTLLALNSERLTASYRVLADWLHKRSIEFVQPTHGLFVFARLAKDLRTMEQDTSYFAQLPQTGLKVSPGHSYQGKEGELGWARIRFSIGEELMRKVVAKLDAIFEQQGRSA
ncbi:hypothetical protein E8E12_004288 [Didymella heteroderae]|uniref:Aminotransferase class I/classII large domain-containing protein n=1 Tax=Didymella heteroderae TaxID=1769908 RepID=A0A9P5C4E5_9PLEO|nr:hypothetical protein E8E12_004288 [Didymella heteroderae]